MIKKRASRKGVIIKPHKGGRNNFFGLRLTNSEAEKLDRAKVISGKKSLSDLTVFLVDYYLMGNYEK